MSPQTPEQLLRERDGVLDHVGVASRAVSGSRHRQHSRSCAQHMRRTSRRPAQAPVIASCIPAGPIMPSQANRKLQIKSADACILPICGCVAAVNRTAARWAQGLQARSHGSSALGNSRSTFSAPLTTRKTCSCKMSKSSTTKKLEHNCSRKHSKTLDSIVASMLTPAGAAVAVGLDSSTVCRLRPCQGLLC